MQNEYVTIKKFLKDENFIGQKIPRHILSRLYHISEDLMAEAEKESLILLHHYRDDNYSVQICINPRNAENNNGYVIFMFDDDDNLLSASGFNSLTEHPPVWNREFGGLDYLDFLGIQKQINAQLANAQKPIMEYDLSTAKRSFYIVKGSPEEISKKIQKDEIYNILALNADASPDMVRDARQKMGFNDE